MGWRRHKKVIDMVKGYRGRAKNCYTVAVNRYEKGLQHAFKHRRMRRRDARQSWITQVNAASRLHGVKYSALIHGLSKANIELNRKILSELAVTEPYSFKAVCETVKAANPEVLSTPFPLEAPDELLFGIERREV